MRVNYSEGNRSIQAKTGRVNVSYNRGVLTASYRSEYVQTHSLAEMRARFAELDAEAEAKRERAKAREAAQYSPVHGYLRHTLEQVVIRGKHAGHGKLLITRADGSKEMAEPYAVLRDLTEDELARLHELAAEVDRTANAIPKPQQYQYVVAALDLPAEATAHYDFEADEEVLVLPDGTEVRGGSADSNFDAYLREQVAKTHPYSVKFKEVRPVSPSESPESRVQNVGNYDDVFTSKEEAEAFLAAKEASEEARRVFTKAMNEYAFDTSVFED